MFNDDCCEYADALRYFLGKLLDNCSCSCHDWEMYEDDED